MSEPDFIWLTALLFTPCAFAVALLFFPRGSERAMCWWTLTGTAATLGISIAIFLNYRLDIVDQVRPGAPDYPIKRQMISLDARSLAVTPEAGDPANAHDWIARTPWIEPFGIDYFLGIDGFSMPLILLTTFLMFLAMMASFGINRYESPERLVRGYCILFLLLETGILGIFVSLDFFLFYVFWELMLFPMYFLIGVWGGSRREYAALKFFLYTLFGSVLLLVPLLAFYFSNLRDFVPPARLEAAIEQAGGLSKANQAVVHTFDLIVLSRAGQAALQYLNHNGDIRQISTSPILNAARREVAQLEAKQADSSKAKAKLAALEKEVKDRLESQWFFRPWFQYAMFWLLFIGFAIKIPIVPLHTWLPDAHVEAPTPISMILAGVLLKLGGYGFVRLVWPICPYAAQQLAIWIGLFGVMNIVYGAFAALAQTDFKKLVAYSSVCHMGYVVLGIAAWSGPENATGWSLGMNGAMFQMIAHGITSAGMFFCVGMLYERAHHRNLDNFRGINESMPLYAGISAILFFAAMGIPGMCGFIGEIMVILSAWSFAPAGKQWVGIVFAILGAATMLITAGSILWTLQRVLMGTNPATKKFTDARWEEVTIAGPMIVLAIGLGVFPWLLLSWMEPSVTHLVESLVYSKP
ncbi:MAG: NADH-quinone oxidoreductase subunit M [Gemmataceae bacterium]